MQNLLVGFLAVFSVAIIETISEKGPLDCLVQGTIAENTEFGFLLNKYNGGFIIPRFPDTTIAEVDISPEIPLHIWRFIPSQGPYYDVMAEINDQLAYLGIDRDGFLRIIPCSSNGNQFVPYACRPCFGRCPNYATTIWKPTCDGTMIAEVNNQTLTLYFSASNIALYTFAKGKPSRTVLLTLIFIPINPSVLNNPKSLKKAHIILDPLNYAAGLINLILDTATYPKSEPTRCVSGSTPSQIKNESANGCGTDKGIGSFVPQYRFRGCCNAHDYCWTDCRKGFSECNIEFLHCLQRRCDNTLPVCNLKTCNLLEYSVDNMENETMLSQFLSYFPFCHGAAWVYHNSVSTNTGAKNFNIENRVACKCKPSVSNPTCNIHNFAQSSIFGMAPMATGTFMGFDIGPEPTYLAKVCADCCRSWTKSLKDRTACCILQIQYNRPNNTCAPPEFVDKCCCVSVCPCR